ncbi:hypothetical protein [Phytohabitans flavus]|uniref:hypothetical protein n=1 Tax=Phytohabitans flavus TaxID=1076124 RepID=UPI001566978F|nr:hypothetical protein [Phytohabitans flavus]
MARSNASRARSRIVAYPSVSPFDFHGVPQHSDPIVSGTRIGTLARAQRARKAARTPESPNIADVHEGK